MLDGSKVLAVIGARGGSKGLPRKNALPVAGKPLIVWSIEAAHGSKLIDRTILSTDDDEIAGIAHSHGCEVPFRRPADLASDDATSLDMVLHALDQLDDEFGWVVLLQPTSPLRTSADIDAALELCARGSAGSCVSVTPIEEPLAWTYGLDAQERLVSLNLVPAASRRQEAPLHVRLNGAIYATRVDALRSARRFVNPETLAYVMPRERSIDIDDQVDLIIADALLRRAKC